MVSISTYFRYYKSRFQSLSPRKKFRVVALTLITTAFLIFISSSSTAEIQNNIIYSNYTSWFKETFKHSSGGDSNKKDAITDAAQQLEDLKNSKINFYKSIFKTLENNKPEIKLDNYEYDQNAINLEDILSSKNLAQIGKFSVEFIDSIKKSHSQYLKQMPEFDENLLQYKGNGVIILGGGDQSWLALLSTRMFRRMGGLLPVEVMLPRRNDYDIDRDICDVYLPQLNAKCVVITEKLGIETQKEEELFFKDFNINDNAMHRSLALLTSNFENVLLLESDNLLIKPLDESIFTSDPFKSNGLIVWPDFWKRITSPFFYSAAGVHVENSRIRDSIIELPESKYHTSSKADSLFALHDRKGAIPDVANDSGELMISKKTHWKTLLLAMYYNLYGVGYYYPLLGQTHNIAEKETFAAAATVLKNKYYQVKSSTEANGFFYNGDFRGVGMLQFDPIVDYYSLNSFMDKYSESNPDKITAADLGNYLGESSERRSALFFAVNFPRLLPIELLNDRFIVKENGDRIKMFGDTPYFNNNLEITLWRIMNDYICHYELHCSYLDKHFPMVKKNNKNDARAGFCNDGMKQHLLWLAG
ncbi:glycosyltransferase family 71 protein, partial [[Candida] arabinofermentans NRRL YB-2248]